MKWFVVFLGLGLTAWADEAAEGRLREALRTVSLQFREAQTERDTLKALNEQAAREKGELSEQLAAANKRAEEEKAAAARSVQEMETRVSNQAGNLERLNEALAKWKAGYNEATSLAIKKERERARLAAEKIELQRRVDDQQRKNAEMFRIGNEILTRYQRFGLGTALTAREPFVGTTRVKLQNLVQDYGDKLAAQRVTAVASQPPIPTEKP